MQINLNQAIRAQGVLRTAAKLPEEEFGEEEFVRMITDEIRELRGQGASDKRITEILQQEADVTLDPEAIARYFDAEDAKEHHKKSAE